MLTMNFYGTTSGPQHKLFGRVTPIMDAMQLALHRAAEQPLPTVEFAHQLPAWGHNIASELTSTIFKRIVNFAPKGRQYHARNCGQIVGCMLRSVYFYWKDVPATLEREGLTKLTQEQEKKLYKLSGWELACAHASKLSGKPVKTKAQLTKFLTRRLTDFALGMVKVGWALTRFGLQQPVENVLQFLTGIPTGFKCFLKPDGEFAKTGKRTEVFMVLLAYWPEIEEMRKAEPPLEKPYVLAWLEKQEGKQLIASEHAFGELCNDIKLDFGLTGHPFNRDKHQV